MDEEKYHGAFDNRSEEKKLKDIHFVEVVRSATPVDWKEKKPEEWRKFSIRNQDGSGSCVAQTIAKLAEIQYFLERGEKVPFSASSIYPHRSNKPEAGMIGVEAFDIWRKKGIAPEVILPSQNLSDAKMDESGSKLAEDTAKPFAVQGFVQLPFDIEIIASTIQATGKGVMTWYFADMKEWNQDMPTIINAALTLANASVRHSVSGIDISLYQGKKSIITDDSWGKFHGLNGQRVLTEDFISKRLWFCAYPKNFRFVSYVDMPEVQKPKHRFTKNLKFIPLNDKGQISNIPFHESQKDDVIGLQNILKFEGLLPDNIDSTGYYGSLTSKSVLAFQKKYAIASVEELDALKGQSVGPKTIAKLNSLYSM